ncbi:MAG: hypothetical protein ACI9KI_001280 [Patiriisocius sp.]|jgi:hypothetical protein
MKHANQSKIAKKNKIVAQKESRKIQIHYLRLNTLLITSVLQVSRMSFPLPKYKNTCLYVYQT